MDFGTEIVSMDFGTVIVSAVVYSYNVNLNKNINNLCKNGLIVRHDFYIFKDGVLLF